MRELTEKELMLISGGNNTIEFEWLGSNGGYTGPTWSSGGSSVTVGGSVSGGEPSVGVGVSIEY
jgi:bacteriocin-like protein